jgi:hypothetical protein
MRDIVEDKGDVFFVKKFEYTIIPEENGNLEIGASDITYFDTVEGRYITLLTEPVDLIVTGEDIVQEKPLRGERRVFGAATLQFIKDDMKSMKNVTVSPLQSYPYFVYHIVLTLVTAALFLFILKKERLEKNVGLLRMKRARSSAIQLLDSAHAQIETKQFSAAADTIYRALISYAADKAKKSPHDVTAKNAKGVLDLITGIDASTKDEFIDLFESCMMVKFSTKQTQDSDLIRDLHSRSVGVVNRMENQWTMNQK